MSRSLLLFFLWVPLWSSMAKDGCVEVFEEEDGAGPIFSPKATNQLRALGFKDDEIYRIQQSYTGLIIEPSLQRGNFNKQWTLFVSHGVDSLRFQDLCFVAFVSKNEEGYVVVDSVQWAESSNENYFWPRLARLHDIESSAVEISLQKSQGRFQGSITIPAAIRAKMEFKHLIKFTPDLLKDYWIEKISQGRNPGDYHRYRLESNRADRPQEVVSSPFDVLAHLGSGTVAQEDRKARHRRRLIMILKQGSKDSYDMISLYENPYQ